MYNQLNLFMAEHPLTVISIVVGVLMLLPLYIIFILPGQIERDRLKQQQSSQT